MFFPISEWFPAFVLTLLVELPIVVILVRRADSAIVRVAVLAGYGNLATHLAVWYVITQLTVVGTTAYVVVAESWAIGAEAGFYAVAIRGLGWRAALVTAVTANAASFTAGRLLTIVAPGALG